MPPKEAFAAGPLFRHVVEDDDALAVVETEMAVLQRSLERLARRSDIHRDLDRASYLLARTLDSAGPISISNLASTLGLDATTVTRQVAVMGRRGLIRRRSDPNDGRVTRIGLSPAGRERMRLVQGARRERMGELLAGWPDGDQRELGRLLGQLNDAVHRAEESGD